MPDDNYQRVCITPAQTLAQARLIPLHTSLPSIPAMWKKATIRLKIRQIEQFLRTFGMCRSCLAAACPHRIFS